MDGWAAESIVNVALDASLVREVSRSFAVSLQLLPRPMRRVVSLAYLLARASDTLADTEGVPVGERMGWLDGFVGEVQGGGSNWREQVDGFVSRQTHQGEKRLLGELDGCFAELDGLPPDQAALVRDVVGVITSGQRLDLERFAGGLVALADDGELEDYCYRVAGCVGAFWTDAGFATMGSGFSDEAAENLRKAGVAYGKGLQLVNILRDLPGDLREGRCYLPVADPGDRQAIVAAAEGWRKRARGWLAEGEWYAGTLKSRRLRAATGLPVMLGLRTLDLLDRADWEAMEKGVKVSRATVRRCLWRALIS